MTTSTQMPASSSAGSIMPPQTPRSSTDSAAAASTWQGTSSTAQRRWGSSYYAWDKRSHSLDALHAHHMEKDDWIKINHRSMKLSSYAKRKKIDWETKVIDNAMKQTNIAREAILASSKINDSEENNNIRQARFHLATSEHEVQIRQSKDHTKTYAVGSIIVSTGQWSSRATPMFR